MCLIERNLVFGQTDKEYLTADVYRPREGKDLPAVILIHGGGFQAGSKEMYQDWGPYLAEQGFVAMAINYRLTTESYSTWPGLVEDVRSAVNWLVCKSNEWGIDPQRIGLIGDSAGAYLAVLYSVKFPINASYKINAVVGVYGSYDTEQSWKHQVSTNSDRKIEKVIGSTPDDAPEHYRDASPIHHIVQAAANPAFDTSYMIVWGDMDTVAHPSQSENFASKLKEAGIDTRTLVVPDDGHFWFNVLPGVEGGTIKDYPNTVVAPQVLAFLKERLYSPVVGNFSNTQLKKIQEMKFKVAKDRKCTT
ncbi:alpha/beta hydrolase [Ammoniphilus sp. CFH 90114]|uniref:alpha/beta hydrolase n=1 Tax=Ammoniphilus sp. CFH 90114 TaxID=2493665 RepID=UPI00100FF6AE|nr:alpha/beta hydrolase [Ammoniphilus sp. CFH 90114]RXT02836.1 alpha/beta hydrolase [Ammoniphilus sp. CFH 90114]